MAGRSFNRGDGCGGRSLGHVFEDGNGSRSLGHGSEDGPEGRPLGRGPPGGRDRRDGYRGRPLGLNLGDAFGRGDGQIGNPVGRGFGEGRGRGNGSQPTAPPLTLPRVSTTDLQSPTTPADDATPESPATTTATETSLGDQVETAPENANSSNSKPLLKIIHDVFSLKVMINKEKTKVLFAEVNNDFADVLLSFLTLPLGSIVKLLEEYYGKKAAAFGSITNLYNSFVDLDETHFSAEGVKQMVLDPGRSFHRQYRKLKLDITHRPQIGWCKEIGTYYDNIASLIRSYWKRLKTEATTVSHEATGTSDGGVFTVNKASFVICDDLRMVPNRRGIIQTLNDLGIKDNVDGAELRNVTFGFNEIMESLKGSIFSETPLSDIILDNKQMVSAAKPGPAGFSWNRVKKEEPSNSKKNILKVVVQKSTNKLLFVQADDFIELLASFLVIPMGLVESLLGNNTCLTNLDNLYRSISDGIDDKYWINMKTKKKLLKPNLAYGYRSKKTFLPIREDCHPYDVSYVSPEDEGFYFKGPATYMVTDDLTVTPLCMTSGLSSLSRLNIPVSDVDELDMHIGLEEALSILKASLTSNSALTDALMNRTMMKQPKQVVPFICENLLHL